MFHVGTLNLLFTFHLLGSQFLQWLYSHLEDFYFLAGKKMIETVFDWGVLWVKNSLSCLGVGSECPKLSF